MKNGLLTLTLLVSFNVLAQKKDHFVLKSNLVSINNRYYFDGYSKDFSILHSACLSYLRSVSPNWSLGVGLGYRQISVNEISPANGTDENTVAIFATPRFTVRKEESLGRRNKGFVEAGITFNIGVDCKTKDYFGKAIQGNQLINSTSFFFSFGYQYKINDTWKLDFGIMSTRDLDQTMLLNGRKIRLSEGCLSTGISYNF